MLDVLKRVLAASRGGTNATRRTAAGWLCTLLAIGSAPIALQPVYAESYPERTIKIVVPFSPGGPTDVVARLIAQSLSSRLGQNVVVENLGGAGGRIGAKAAASAQPDGYTFFLASPAQLILNKYVLKDLPYDPDADFVPVSLLNRAPFIVLTRHSNIVCVNSALPSGRMRSSSMPDEDGVASVSRNTKRA